MLAPGFDFDGNDILIGYDDRPYVQIMGCNGVNDEAFGLWHEYGSAAAEGIPGGACWSGDDQAIRPVRVQEFPVQVGMNGDHG